MTYFDILPFELLNNLFLKFSYHDSLFVMNHTRTQFKRLYSRPIFWKEQWRYRFSTLVEAPIDCEEAYKKYRSFERVYGDVYACAEQGLDILLFQFLPTEKNKYNEHYQYGSQQIAFGMVFCKAATGGHISLMNKLIDMSKDLDIKLNYNGPLAHAVSTKQLEAVKLLFEKGADWYDMCLIWAAFHGSMDIAKFILENHNKIDHQFYGSITISDFIKRDKLNRLDEALRSAIQKGHLELVKLLIAHGATNLNDSILYSFRGGYVDIARFLLEKGANNYSECLKFLENDQKTYNYMIENSKPGDSAMTILLKSSHNGISSFLIDRVKNYDDLVRVSQINQIIFDLVLESYKAGVFTKRKYDEIACEN